MSTPRKIEVTASVLEDGRRHIDIFYVESPQNDFNPKGWTTVSNIDGSNHYMPDHGGWSFLNHEDRALSAAIELAWSNFNAAHVPAAA